MRRWFIIFLLVVYPFQLALATADRCCVVTAAGVSHHAQAGEANATDVAVVTAGDEGAGAADPHCAACSFSHTAAAPPGATPAPFPHAHAATFAALLPTYASFPAGRPERPQWSNAAA
ncbi:hypothetical protein QPK32_08115 [Massilia sp. YIM B02763]|uniref:hypothetical protein n=1 Tax=Massilia sp. YIM B02763 TaxID=3050130 RepID=UPI0025B68B72|nr:hypothetical protein [Massilia sp. YIM B02763]MDN4053039.1 hypothetical protein [Massilia sp. YIM B02763]